LRNGDEQLELGEALARNCGIPVRAERLGLREPGRLGQRQFRQCVAQGLERFAQIVLLALEAQQRLGERLEPPRFDERLAASPSRR